MVWPGSRSMRSSSASSSGLERSVSETAAWGPAETLVNDDCGRRSGLFELASIAIGAALRHITTAITRTTAKADPHNIAVVAANRLRRHAGNGCGKLAVRAGG